MQDFENSLLNTLAAASADLFALDPVDLPRGRRLEQTGQLSEHVYFPVRGVASVLASNAGGGVEIGMIGPEGVTGIASILGAKVAPFDTTVQISGDGLRARADAVRRAFDINADVRRIILDYVQSFHTQVGASAAANARNTLSERLARWLSIARDRVDTNELALTHDLLAQMLGVRRAGVTMALRDLEDRGLVKGARGVIKILDRQGLISSAHGAYSRADEAMRSR